MRIIRGLLLSLPLALAAGVAGAQADVHRFTVAPRGGYLRFDRASSIAPSGFLGVEAVYAVTSFFTIGPTFAAARPSTRGEDFIASMNFGDTTFLFRVQQPLGVFDVGLAASLRAPTVFAGLAPYLVGSVGTYVIYMDPQVMRGPRSFSKLSAAAGAGVNLRVSDRAGLMFEVRDQIFTNYDRARLNPTQPQFQNHRFIEDFPPPPASKSTIHNLAFSLGFRYVPARDGDTPGDAAGQTTGGGSN